MGNCLQVSWNLGFVEEPESPQLLLRHRFPSKVGGRPVGPRVSPHPIRTQHVPGSSSSMQQLARLASMHAARLVCAFQVCEMVPACWVLSSAKRYSPHVTHCTCLSYTSFRISLQTATIAAPLPARCSRTQGQPELGPCHVLPPPPLMFHCVAGPPCDNQHINAPSPLEPTLLLHCLSLHVPLALHTAHHPTFSPCSHVLQSAQAWLDPVRLPSRGQLTCSASGKPLDFLMQVGKRSTRGDRVRRQGSSKKAHAGGFARGR